MVVALLALFVALGGSAFAATQYRITSTKQIKPRVIRYLKGQRGKPGPQGTAGATKVQRVIGPAAHVPAFESIPSYGTSIAECPTGTTLVGGGARVAPDGPSGGRAAVIAQSYPASDDTPGDFLGSGPVRRWVAVAVNPGPDQYGVYPSQSATVWAYALCASP
jgi:hypothetical protein